jgi:hypothetical protein
MLAAPTLDARARPDRQSMIEVGRKGIDASRSVDAPAEITETLASPGTPLDVRTRAFFESRLGRDLDSVRIHADAPAAWSSRAIHARAFTYGNHIVFGEGQFAPGSAAGQRLLAHELVHVLQASPSTIHRAEIEGAPDEEPEPIELPVEVSPQHDALARNAAEAINHVIDSRWSEVIESDTLADSVARDVEAILRDTFEQTHSFDPQLGPNEAPVLQYYVAQHANLRERLALLRMRASEGATAKIEEYLDIPVADVTRFHYEIFMWGVSGGEMIEGTLQYVAIRYLEHGQPMWTRRFRFTGIGAGVGVAPVSISADWGWNSFTTAEYWEPADFGGGTMSIIGAGVATIGPPNHKNGTEIEYATIYGDGSRIPVEADIGGAIWGTPEAGVSWVTGLLTPFWLGAAPPGPGYGVLPPSPGFVRRPPVQDYMTVGFATGSEKLDEDAKDKVEAFAEKHREVLDGETFTLTLIGHASRTGSPGLNYELSDARRLSVQGAIEHTLEHGIEKHVDGPALGEQLAAAEKMPGDDDSARYRVVEVILVGSTTEEVP